MKWLFFISLLFIIIACETPEGGTSKICNPACSEWQTCNEGKCELKADMCETKNDCKDSTKPVCDLTTHSCVAEIVECDPICDNTWQTCIEGNCETQSGFCKDDVDCTDSVKKSCKNHICVELGASCSDCTDSQHCEDGECKKNKKENVRSRCKDGYDNDGDGYIDCDDYNCQGFDFCNLCKDVECGNQSCDPATGKCIEVELTTIKEIRDSHVDGKVYKTKGIVVAGDKNGLFIQDNSDRGIYIFINPAQDEFIAQVIGDEITVSGTFKDFHGREESTGLAELINPDILKVEHDKPLPAFKEVDAADIENLDDVESMLVKFKHNDFIVTSANDSGGVNSFLKDNKGSQFILRSDIYNADLVDGDVLTKVQGVLAYKKYKFRVMPRRVEDVVKLAFTCSTACKSSEICVRDHDDVGKCILACSPACNTTYEICTTEGGEAECKLIEGMCDDDGNGCAEHFNCIKNQCIEAVNSIPNGDLEDWTDDETPTDWSYEYGNHADTKVYKETTLVCAGATSAKVRKTAADKKPNPDKPNEFYSPPFPVDVTKEYNVSVQIIDNDPNVKARIFWKFYDDTDHNAECVKVNGHVTCDIQNHYFNYFTSDFDGCKTYTKANNWSFFAGVDDEEKERVRTVRIGVRLLDQDSTDTGYIYVDDFRIEEIPSK